MRYMTVPFFVLLALCNATAQTAQVIDFGNGILQAVGAGGGSTVRVPQSNTFMVVTTDGNVIIDMSGAAAAQAHKQALTAVNAGPVRALYLTDMALAVDPRHRASLEVRVRALETLSAQSNNSNERGWTAIRPVTRIVYPLCGRMGAV